jgi:hypothetical protein
MDKIGNVRQTGSFPGGRHFEQWVGWRLEILEEQKAFSDLRCGWELSEVQARERSHVCIYHVTLAIDVKIFLIYLPKWNSFVEIV